MCHKFQISTSFKSNVPQIYLRSPLGPFSYEIGSISEELSKFNKQFSFVGQIANRIYKRVVNQHEHGNRTYWSKTDPWATFRTFLLIRDTLESRDEGIGYVCFIVSIALAYTSVPFGKRPWRDVGSSSGRYLLVWLCYI